MFNAKLIVVGGDAKASEVQLRLPTVIGRGREASVTLPHPLVSRRHAEIFEQDGRLMVRDLGSLNGTFVNNQRTQGDQVLAPNQLLTLGNVTFRAVYDATELPNLAQVSASQVIEVSAEAAQVGQDDGTTVSPSNDKAESPEGSGFHATNVQVFPQDSVSLSRLSGLPGPVAAVVELAEPLDLGNQSHAASMIDPNDFQLDGAGDSSKVDPSQSDLGSFLRKLPR